MSPVLFTIGAFNVYAFGFFLMLSFLFSTFVVWRYAREEFKEEEYLDLFLYASIVGLISARAIYTILHFDEFELNFLRYIVVRETPGLSLLGGLLGGFIYVYWQIRLKKYDPFSVLDIFSIAASTAFFFAKIGQQLAGSGFGRETSAFFGVRIVGLEGRYHPTEIYEAAIYFLLSIILIHFYKRTQRKKIHAGSVSFTFAVVTLTNIFLLEFLKIRTVYLYGLSLRQIVSLAILLIIMTPFFLWLIKKMVIRLSRRSIKEVEHHEISA